MKLLISLLFGLFGTLATIPVLAKDVVVLVPGFFNSFTPEYPKVSFNLVSHSCGGFTPFLWQIVRNLRSGPF